jgi:hypothetical protein
MLIIWETWRGEFERIHGNSVLSIKFFCKLETAPKSFLIKNSTYLIIREKRKQIW